MIGKCGLQLKQTIDNKAAAIRSAIREGISRRMKDAMARLARKKAEQNSADVKDRSKFSIKDALRPDRLLFEPLRPEDKEDDKDNEQRLKKYQIIELLSKLDTFMKERNLEIRGSWIQKLQKQIFETDPDELKKLINEQILNSMPGEDV